MCRDNCICLEATEDLCNIIEMGPNLFTGQHVIAWKKNFVYGPLLDYKYEAFNL